jgi:hypothetical protein
MRILKWFGFAILVAYAIAAARLYIEMRYWCRLRGVKAPKLADKPKMPREGLIACEA